MKENITKYKDKVKGITDTVGKNKVIKSVFDKYKSQEPKKQKLIMFGSIGVLIFSIVVAIVFNMSGNSYKVLYQNTQPEENKELLASLQEKEVPVKTNAQGEIMVQKKDYDKLLLDLAQEGHPKTAPAYGIFKDNSGFTTTEFEKKQYLIFNLQDQIKKTLEGLDGVDKATVQIVVPNDTAYVLDTEETVSTASVTITMRPGFKLLPEKVTSVRNLVAYSVPKMSPKSVAVVDATTGVTMTSDDSQIGTGFDRLGFQTEIERQINEKVMNVLSMAYDPTAIRVSSTAVFDYDKMTTEEVEYIPGENGEGVKEHFEETIDGNGGPGAGGVVGEVNNTDGIPTYPNTENGQNGNYQQKADYLVSHIKKQIEKDQAVLKDASVSVTVKGGEITEEEQETLINTIAKAVNINPEGISIARLGGPTPLTLGQQMKELVTLPNILLFLLLIALLVGIVLVIKKIKKGKLVEAEEFSEVDVRQDLSLKLKQELEEEKRKIIENAEANKPIQSAVTEDVRGFVKDNPDISAQLIRTWLNEED